MFKVSYATVYNVLKQRSIPLTRRVGNELSCSVCEKWVLVSKARLKRGRLICSNCGRKLVDKTTSWTVKNEAVLWKNLGQTGQNMVNHHENIMDKTRGGVEI